MESIADKKSILLKTMSIIKALDELILLRPTNKKITKKKIIKATELMESVYSEIKNDN